MKIKEIVRALERFAPLPLQEGYDNAGLQIGLTDVEVTGALLCLDVTEAVVTEAVSLGYNLIISHHPLIFKGYKSLTGVDYIERCIIQAIKHDIVIFSAHTNLDNLLQGVNSKIAEKIGLEKLEVLDPVDNQLVKIITFVPSSSVEKVRQALFDTGCGQIGNYDSVSYNIDGMGTFKPLEGSNPFVGSLGVLHYEPEIRIETIVPSYKRFEALNAIKNNHPYEEPVCDMYPILNKWAVVGSGLIGNLKEELEEESFLKMIKEIFHADCVKHSVFTGRKVKRVALCGGAGSFLIKKALAAKADVFITGEIKYHEYFGHEKEILLAEIGHYESEQYTQEIFYKIINDMFPEVDIKMTEVNTNPIKYL